MQRREKTAEERTANQGSRERYNPATAIFGGFLLYIGEEEVLLDLNHRGNKAKSIN